MQIFDVNNAELKMDGLRPLVQALPGGQFLVVGRTNGWADKNSHVLRLDNTLSVIQTLIVTPERINELILMRSDVLLLHDNSITRVRLRDGEVVEKNKVGDLREWVRSGLVLDEGSLLLVERGESGRIFTYRLSDGHTEDKVKNLNSPQSVIRIKTKEDTLFVVCESGSKRVNIYNSRWRLQTSITETPDGPLLNPTCVLELPSEPASILIADHLSCRISQFTTEGRFIRHLIKGEDKIKHPNQLSYCHPHLYVTSGLNAGSSDVKCFKLYNHIKSWRILHDRELILLIALLIICMIVQHCFYSDV